MTDLNKGPWANRVRKNTRTETTVVWIMSVAMIVAAGLALAAGVRL